MKNKRVQRKFRHLRVKSKIKKTLPRLVVFRSNKHIYAQIIDDSVAKTLGSASDVATKAQTKMEKAKETGLKIASVAIKKNIKKIVFDRAGYKYHGRVKALAEGAREGGLTF